MTKPTLAAPLAKAMQAAWPKHFEGTGGTGPNAPNVSWTVSDPTLPSDGLVAAILAALRADPEAYEALVRFAQEWLDDDETDSLDRLLGPKP